MMKKTLRHGFVALVVCAACLGLAGCGDEAQGSTASEGSGAAVTNQSTASASEAPPTPASASGDQVDDVDAAGEHNDADAPPSGDEEDRVFYGRVVSIGDALYTAELQMDGELAVGTQPDIEEWNAQTSRNPHALYLDCRVDTGFDLTGEQMESLLVAMRSVELNPLSNVDEVDLSAAGDAYTVAAVDELGSVMWKALVGEHWIVATVDDVLRCFGAPHNAAFGQIGALQS